MVKVHLVNHTDINIAIEAMNNCYGNKCTTKSLINAVNAGHLSLLEHASATFQITCSEAVLKQITRHRHLSFTVESSRGSDISKNGFYLHDDVNKIAINGLPTDNDTLKVKELYDAIVVLYTELIKFGISKEEAAYVLPMATNVKMTVTGNLRAWYEYLMKRLCKRASLEHRVLATKIYDELKKVYPDIFNIDLVFDKMCSNCNEKSCSFC